MEEGKRRPRSRLGRVLDQHRGFQDWSLAEAAIFGAGMVPEDRQQRSRLGKMFARILAGPVHQVRPYLGPMYAWTSWDFRADAADREPHAALVTSTSQQRCLEGLRVAAGEVFRIDAKVEGSDLIVLGGRFTGSPPDKRTAKLLSTRITREHVRGGRSLQDDRFARIAGGALRGDSTCS